MQEPYTLLTLIEFWGHVVKRRKIMYIKIKDENPSIKGMRQMRAQVNTTKRKNKSKQSTKVKVKILFK
jgi:hypothetical protein